MMDFFDGHNDTALRRWMAGDRRAEGFLDGSADDHVTLPKARAGGLIGGFFAVWAPQSVDEHPETAGQVVDRPPNPPIDVDQARRHGLEIADILTGLARRRPDAFRLCRDAGEIDAARAAGAIAAILHIEGAEPLGADLGGLESYYAAGLRSLGPVWSRPNAFGFGVPFRFPGGPEEGPGLTDAGCALVRACGEMGVLVDLSHMNAAGFRDIARLSDQPLMATHSNAHALCPSSRNLTDAQLDEIAERRGIVGLNFACGFLREDGRALADTALNVMTRHLAHLVERLGEDGVALGSDFDGAMIPQAIGDAAGLPALVGAMRDAGFGEALIAKICAQNWLGFLHRVLPPR